MEQRFEDWEANEHYMFGTEISQAEKRCSAPAAHQLDLQHQR